MSDLPVGKYRITVKGRSGYWVEPKNSSCEVTKAKVAHLSLSARRVTFARSETLAAPTIASVPWWPKKLARGAGWNSKPLAIRVRIGGGGSYHCEFEAPPGLHVTRAKLVSNLDGNEASETESEEVLRARARARYVDTVLESTQRAHLYAPARGGGPATGYAFLNLRPRAETIVRPATVTAFFAMVILGILAYIWNDPPKGFNASDPPLGLLAVLLGGPGALAAYFAQAVPSRVTNAMLYGVRLLSLVPLLLSLCAAGAILQWGANAGTALLAITATAVVSLTALYATYWFAEHPREQRPISYRQGEDFEETHLAPFGPEEPVPAAAIEDGVDDNDLPATIRDRMLERSGGMTAATRRKLLGQRWFRWWTRDVAPALYFDSAEPPAVFLGLPSKDQRSKLRSLTNDLLARCPHDGGGAAQGPVSGGGSR